MVEKHSNAAEFTVSEISSALRKTIEDNFGNIRVRGEISGFRGVHASGHAYFALKDDKARLEAVIWRNTLQGLKFSPEEGLEVIAGGRLSSYPGSSKYQIIIDSLEPAGAGALMALLEERRKKLAAAGFFDEARKKRLPFMPRIIGVITSPTGAVIRDIIHRIADRFPLHILVWPVRVQGETAAAETIAAIRGFNALPESNKKPAGKAAGLIPRPDLLIIARGGGSLEDLWGFNDEDLVRAAAQSDLPIISAIGHETDWTLLDYTADKRAPTPTGAAEIAVPVKADLQANIANLAMRLYHASRRFISHKWQIFSGLTRAFPTADRLLADPRRRFDDITARLKQALLQMLRQKRTSYDATAGRAAPYLMTRLFTEKRKHYRQNADRLTRAFSRNTAQHKQKLAALDRLIKTLSYQSILERGFALVIDKKHRLIRQAKEIAPKQNITLRFADGTVEATAKAINSNPSFVETARQNKIIRSKRTSFLAPNSHTEICLKKDKKKREPEEKPRQGNLF